MRKDVTDRHVRLAATTALLNSLEFTKANFDKEVGHFKYWAVDKLHIQFTNV